MNETMKVMTPAGVAIVEMKQASEISNTRLEYLKTQFGFLGKGLSVKHKIKFCLDSLVDDGASIAGAFCAEREGNPSRKVSLRYPHSRFFRDGADDEILFDSMARALLLCFGVVSREAHIEVVDLVHIGQQRELL